MTTTLQARMAAGTLVLGGIPGSGLVESIFSNDHFKEYIAQFIIAMTSQFVSAAISVIIDYFFYGPA
jgi:hypothetical protein